MTTSESPRSRRVQPLRALRALRALVRNPQDTERVFEVMDALRGRTSARNLQRLATLRPEMLARRDDILATLCDRDALARLPAGSLGRHYLAFCEREGITPDGLVAASRAAGRREDEGAQSWLERRGRDTHDLWHVVTGYGTQPSGEICVVTFSFAQIGHWGFGAIALAGTLRHARSVGWRRSFSTTWQAFRNGRGSVWLPAQDWADLLPRPLGEVREMLGVRLPEVDAAAIPQPEPLAA